MDSTDESLTQRFAAVIPVITSKEAVDSSAQPAALHKYTIG
jgi:hypothetical protein